MVFPFSCDRGLCRRIPANPLHAAYPRRTPAAIRTNPGSSGYTRRSGGVRIEGASPWTRAIRRDGEGRCDRDGSAPAAKRLAAGDRSDDRPPRSALRLAEPDDRHDAPGGGGCPAQHRPDRGRRPRLGGPGLLREHRSRDPQSGRPRTPGHEVHPRIRRMPGLLAIAGRHHDREIPRSAAPHRLVARKAGPTVAAAPTADDPTGAAAGRDHAGRGPRAGRLYVGQHRQVAPGRRSRSGPSTRASPRTSAAPRRVRLPADTSGSGRPA